MYWQFVYLSQPYKTPNHLNLIDVHFHVCDPSYVIGIQSRSQVGLQTLTKMGQNSAALTVLNNDQNTRPACRRKSGWIAAKFPDSRTSVNVAYPVS